MTDKAKRFKKALLLAIRERGFTRIAGLISGYDFEITDTIAAGTAEVSGNTITGDFTSKAMPEGWTYITNNESYPNPDFYSGGFKFNYENEGIQSPNFTASTSNVAVLLNVAALNQNTKTGSSADYFTVTAYNTNDEVVTTGAFTNIVNGNNEITLNGTGITYVKIMMTGYPYDGTKYCNVSVASITITVQ